jgi:hypothetical protein
MPRSAASILIILLAPTGSGALRGSGLETVGIVRQP